LSLRARVNRTSKLDRRLAWGLALALLSCSTCATLDLGESPPDPGSCQPEFAYYRDTLWPEYLAPPDPARSCVAASGCHDIADGRSALRVDTVEPVDHERNYSVVTRFLDCASPDTSPLLIKPLSGQEGHGGGDLFDDNSAAIGIFLDWFNQ
jgi:hypothetical protein